MAKFFVTAAFPYPNSPQHIGHARTYSMADTYARFKALYGFHVLFPMAFHVTGTPIIGMAERIKENDEDIIDVLVNIYGIPKEKLKELEDPKNLVMYFSNEIEQGMKEMNFAIDWSRKFYTFDEHFNKFIQWQFKKLMQKGYLVKGEHYVAWSKKLNSAVGAHDTKGDIDPVIEEVTAIKFGFEDGFLIATTYRPETIFGVTNIWINKNAKYLKLKTDKGEIYYISKETLPNFEEQISVKVIEELDGNYFIGKNALLLTDNSSIPIYEASFVNPAEGTGVVMSVPAHAPFDYIALKDIGKLEIKKIINIKGRENKTLLVEQVLNELGIKNQHDKRLEEATKIVYMEEFNKGYMLVFKQGLKVKEAKEEVKKFLKDKNIAFSYYVIANGPIKTRANDIVVVKKVKNQWFIDYGNKEWKELSLKCLEKMKIFPKEVKKEIENTILWLDKKACTRSRGFGTKFPFDETQVIESLSDSTIYPAFYTIADKIKNFNPDELTEEFFDYVFLGIGKPKNEKHKELRDAFTYWYGVDSRHSGPDLIRNHITFYIMNHVAIFPEHLWPKQIVINGFVLMDGKKMSKSLGNILPLRKAIKEHGADVIRFSVITGSDLMQATDFNATLIEGIKSRLAYFKDIIKKSKGNGNSIADKWIMELMKSKANRTKEYVDKIDFRSIGKELFYDFYHELRWYEEMKKGKIEIDQVIKLWAALINPLLPDFTKDIDKESVKEHYEYDKNLIASMDVLRSLHSDINALINRLNKKHEDIKTIKVIIPAQWKYVLFQNLKDGKSINDIIQLMPDKREQILSIVKSLKNKIYSIPDLPSRDLFIKCLEEAQHVFPGKVIIEEEEQSKEQKASYSLPLKPAFILD